MPFENWLIRSVVLVLMTFFMARVWADSVTHASLNSSGGQLATHVDTSKGFTHTSK